MEANGPRDFPARLPWVLQVSVATIPVNSFRLSRTQRRILNRNTTDVGITIAVPTMTGARLELFKAFHEHGHQMKGWPAPGNDIDGEAESRLELFLRNPFRTEEWTYWIGDRLVGVGYVDALAEGLSAIYFFHDPREHRRSLGTFNILKVIRSGWKCRDLPHVGTGVLRRRVSVAGIQGAVQAERDSQRRPMASVHGLANSRWTAERDCGLRLEFSHLR